MKLTTKEIVKRVKKEYPRGVDLVYIDYSDSFDEDKKAMEELAQTGFIESFFENNDWTCDSQWEGIRCIKENVFTEEEQEEIDEDEELKQAFDDICYELDTSDPLKDLLHNTCKRYFYYDLNLEIEAGFGNDGFYEYQKEKWPESEARKIANKLRINYKKHKQELDLMVGQASYGGQLVILFVADPEDLWGEKGKFIKFKNNYSICIMDRGQGSGDHTELKIPELVFEFKRENLHDDIGDSGYSYSNEVCGLCMGEETDFSWTNKQRKTDKIIKIQTNKEAEELREREENFEKIYKEGKCSLGDMKYSRHKETEYINNFPCGHKCKACGNFWVD